MVAAVSGGSVLVAEPGRRRKGCGLDEWSQLGSKECGGRRHGDDTMVLIGCFLPFILALVGAVAGHLLGSGSVGLWGMGIGFATGLALAAVIGALALQSKRD
jgi:hypothetical protein